MEEPAPKSSSKVVNFGLYKIKKTLREEGFEVLEKPNGNISLVIRVGKERENRKNFCPFVSVERIRALEYSYVSCAVYIASGSASGSSTSSRFGSAFRNSPHCSESRSWIFHLSPANGITLR